MGRRRDEPLEGAQSSHLEETKCVVARWRMDYNRGRPHGSLSDRHRQAFAPVCRTADCIRPHMPVLDGVQDRGILAETLD